MAVGIIFIGKERMYENIADAVMNLLTIDIFFAINRIVIFKYVLQYISKNLHCNRKNSVWHASGREEYAGRGGGR